MATKKNLLTAAQQAKKSGISEDEFVKQQLQKETYGKWFSDIAKDLAGINRLITKSVAESNENQKEENNFVRTQTAGYLKGITTAIRPENITLYVNGNAIDARFTHEIKGFKIGKITSGIYAGNYTAINKENQILFSAKSKSVFNTELICEINPEEFNNIWKQAREKTQRNRSYNYDFNKLQDLRLNCISAYRNN